MGHRRQAGLRAKPFLRWAGGKSKFVQEILERLPELPPRATYYEPFLGAGSVFLAYAPNRAVLSDLNPHLIKTFEAVKRHPLAVAKTLKQMHRSNCKKYYYRSRIRFNAGGNSQVQAARFIYLNQTSFNGIYRVNVKGQYNVPYGYKRKPKFPGAEALAAAARQLKKATIVLADYKHALASAKRGDVVYLDPPYPPLNGTAYFTHYTKERFSSDEQKQVAQTANELRARGCHVIVTNANTQEIKRLYADWHRARIRRPRWITCSCRKHRVDELIITSYGNGGAHDPEPAAKGRTCRPRPKERQDLRCKAHLSRPKG